MANRYVSDPRTIILCVIPANQDMTTSDGLQMARELDPNGLRTIGVITKIDIMDKGTNARNMLSGKDVPLRLGYVGVKNRSQQDINDNMSVRDAIEREKLYFATHQVYSSLP
jgi:vacuolar protein sorting-associated protein 1